LLAFAGGAVAVMALVLQPSGLPAPSVGLALVMSGIAAGVLLGTWFARARNANTDGTGEGEDVAGGDFSHTSAKAINLLRIERDAAVTASAAKSAMLADVSHEIRTPINVVIGMIELSLESEDAEEQRRYLRLAQSSSEAMLSIVNDILDFSKIEAGKLEVDFKKRNQERSKRRESKK